MTLSDFATFSTALSGLAVTASVIYLALQTHQNNKHTRALIHQGRIGRISDTQLVATNADLAEAIIVANGGKATPEDVKMAQFRAFCIANFYGWQDTYLQHQMGLLDNDIFVQMQGGVVNAMKLPGFRAQWESNIRVPGTKFAVFVDEIIATLPSAPPVVDN